jgi:hypothetical protein
LTKRTRARAFIGKEASKIKKSLNYITLVIFAPVLILAGIAGFFMPASLNLMSHEPLYNLFHIFFGSLGLLIVASKREFYIALFNALFGLIDIYQVIASVAFLPPRNYFLWTGVDDILHVIIGAALLVIGLYGLLKLRQPENFT